MSTKPHLGAFSTPYPPNLAGIPAEVLTASPYCLHFAYSAADVSALQRLRFEVFNLELREGLQSSFETGLDADQFDASCHHLMVTHSATREVVGTYRLQTQKMAQVGQGWYSATEFDLSSMPSTVLRDAVEIGRACIAKEHRSLKVLYLLWCGLGLYLQWNKKRYLFGCNSLTSQDPDDGISVYRQLQKRGHMHATINVPPQSGMECISERLSTTEQVKTKIPRLMRVYLSMGAKICSPPAIDRQFRTIDFMALFDMNTLDQRALSFFHYTPS